MSYGVRKFFCSFPLGKISFNCYNLTRWRNIMSKVFKKKSERDRQKERQQKEKQKWKKADVKRPGNARVRRISGKR
jgi:hypothetical protein